MNGIRPFALSLQRLLSSNNSSYNRDDLEAILVHKIFQIIPISPEKIFFPVDCVKQAEILEETLEMNKSLDSYLENFRPDSPKVRLTVPPILHRTTLSSPSSSSLRRRRTVQNNIR